MKNNGQMWSMDFTIGILIFTIILISYYTYTANISKEDISTIDNLVSDAKIVASSLTSGGFPNTWNANTVTRIGFTDSNNRLDNDKFNEFNKIDYNRSKKLLGTTYDYLLFFLNASGNVTKVEGFCGTGGQEVVITYDIKAAYYYKDPGDEDQFLFTFMKDEFSADVYTEAGTEPDVTGDYEALGDNLNSYGFVVLEAPEWSVGQFNIVDDEYNSWVDSGGKLMISGELVTGNKKPMVGADFEKISGLSKPDERATVVKEDEFFDWNVEDSLSFNQAFHAVFPATPPDPLASNFKDIARFNESDILFEDILDNEIAVSKWDYGNGKVFFFSDFDAEYFEGTFLETLKNSIKKWMGGGCKPINITGVNRDNLIRVDRLVIYNSNQLKMVLYLWQ